jgi:transforming growth factor-beta-induced protein
LIRKIILPLFVLFTMVLAACAPAASQSTEIAVEPIQPTAQDPTVVVPTVVPTLAPTQEPTETQSGMMSLLDTIKADERLSLFYEALALSGVSDILKGKGPFTVFAPINDAINAVPTLNSMEQYGKIISNHIVSGKIMTADLSPDKLNIAYPESNNLIVITVEDGVLHLHLSAENGGTNTTDAVVITADIETANGVLHVIDTLLLPPTE